MSLACSLFRYLIRKTLGGLRGFVALKVSDEIAAQKSDEFDVGLPSWSLAQETWKDE